MTGTKKLILRSVKNCFDAFRNQLEAEKLDSDLEVVVQSLVILRIQFDRDMGQFELETEAPGLARSVKKHTESLKAPALKI